MSTTTKRDTPGNGASVDHRLARLLDSSSLARVVPHLPATTLHRVIQHLGLEACGELVTLATPAQFAAVLDLDLWRHPQPGLDERFDVDRFGDWLEVLADLDASVAARTIAALDPGVIVTGLSRYVRVFDPGIFEPIAQSDDEAPSRHDAMREGDSLHDYAPVRDSSAKWTESEIGGYLIRARRTDAWDAIVALLVALDAEHQDAFHAVMRGCRELSNSRPEDDGLDDLLRAPEQHLHEMTVGRERRRSQQGYATPADARAFLQMARQSTRGRADAATTDAAAVHPIVAAYFRAADEAPDTSDEPRPARLRETLTVPHGTPARLMHAPPDASDDATSIEAVIELLAEAGLMEARPRALLPAADGDPQAAALARFRRLMTYARDHDEAAYFRRSRELAFLANTLLAGCSVQSRPFTPAEASDAAASVCNLGLEHMAPPERFLIDHDLVTAFEVGWSVLYQDVSLFVAHRLIATLDDLQCLDPDIQDDLVVLRRALARHRDAGTPWLARDSAEVLAMLDPVAWASVVGLLDECPVLPAALTATLDGRATSVSPTKFSFISTTTQIDDVRRFMQMLPDLLSG